MVQDSFCTHVSRDRLRREAFDTQFKIEKYAETIYALWCTRNDVERDIGKVHILVQAQTEAISKLVCSTEMVEANSAARVAVGGDKPTEFDVTLS